MTYQVIFNPEAQNDLLNLYQFITERGFPERAAGYIERLEQYCLRLQTFPQRGRPIDPLRPNVRIVSFEKRAQIAFEITSEAVIIFRILYGGRDLPRPLREK